MTLQKERHENDLSSICCFETANCLQKPVALIQQINYKNLLNLTKGLKKQNEQLNAKIIHLKKKKIKNQRIGKINRKWYIPFGKFDEAQEV